MLFKAMTIAVLVFLIGCARSEKLDEKEMRYVALSVALTQARFQARDTVILTTKLAAVYKKFGIGKDGFTEETQELGKDPERTSLVFKAISDSLNVK